MSTIRPVQDADWPALWRILEPVFRAGESYALPRDLSESDARSFWISQTEACCVAVDERGDILGSYYLKPNQPGPGDHVCNSGYVVAGTASGRGLGSALCDHSQEEARRRGYRAMQYNLVVASNERAVRLWQRHGFEIIGTLPMAFRHPSLGFVDAHVMYKTLRE